MKKLAIISSYNEECGNATYTEVLRKEFSKHFEVDVLALKVNYLTSSAKRVKKLADKHIVELSEKLRNYDYVNIQFEAGLYGVYTKDIISRMKILIHAAPNLIVTMHRVDIPVSAFDKNILRDFYQSGIKKTIKNLWSGVYISRLYVNIIDYLKKESKKKNVQVIVHTRRDADNIREVLGFNNVVDFPLTFLNEPERTYYLANSDKNVFLNNYGLTSDSITIGVFGFLGEYKGYETAIRALALLPDKYKLLVFGEQHPMSIRMFESVNHYIEKLMLLIEKNNLTDRVLFIGGLKDEPFICALHCVDYVALPYLEVNQGGSGIASLTIETKAKALFSRSKAFHELQRYFPDCFTSFDIGNYHELAYKIKTYHEDYRDNIEQNLQKYNISNNILLHMSLFAKGDSL